MCDVTPIEWDDLVLRRVPDVWVVRDPLGPRPSSQAFNNDGDGEPMSGYLDSSLREHSLSRADIVADHDGFYAVALQVGLLLDEEQSVLRDPIEPPGHICDPAHATVAGTKANNRRKRLSRAARWVAGSCPPGAVDCLGE